MKKTKNMAQVMILHFGAILLALLVLFGSIGVGMIQINAAKAVIALNNQDLLHLYSAEVAHYKWSGSLNSAINYGSEFTGGLDPKTCGFGEYVYKADHSHDSNFGAFLGRVEPIHNDIHASATTILGQVSTNKEGAVQVFLTQSQPKIEALVGEINSLIDMTKKTILEEEAKLAKITLSLIVAAVIDLVVILLISSKLFYLLKKDVAGGLIVLAKEIKKLEEGNLSLSLATHYKITEIEEIRRALDHSSHQLSSYVGAIGEDMRAFSDGDFVTKSSVEFRGDFMQVQKFMEDFSRKMTDILMQISTSSDQVYAGAEQVSSGAQLLADGSTEQASSVEELSATINELSTQVKGNAGNAQKASAMAKEAASAIGASNAQMQQLMGAMTEISATSGEIGKIIKTIEDIAFQTNILALNASVEAARAGMAGKGFAVVADEVRNLAGKSADAANSITQLIQSSLQSVDKGVLLAENTANHLHGVVDVAENNTKVIEEISVETENQANAIYQVSLGLDQISAVVQTNSATSEESAAAAMELSTQANLLKKLFAHFRLN